MTAPGTSRTFQPYPRLSAFGVTDGVIGRPACRSLEILGAALQADGGTRSAFAASSIRRRSAAWTILPDWTYQSSSPPSFGRPAAHETLLLFGRVVGTEVGISLVRLSPKSSWTRGSLSTSDCRHGPSSAPEHAS